MWDKTDGCATQYRCSIAYNLMSFLSKSYQIVVDRAVDTTGNGKYVVDGFNAVQKWYLSIFLIILSTSEVNNIDSKRMRVYAMTDKGEVSFAKKCKHLPNICDKIGTKGDKKHTKREAKAHLNHK